MTTDHTVTLSDGRTMPRLGFGTYGLRGQDAPGLMVQALEAGYRLLDTATRYENEVEVGTAVRDSGLPRDEVFVTTKLPGSEHGRDTARPALEASLERLGLDHVDLYLIHWPLPRVDRYVETWEALVELREAGLARSIGVSNFLPGHLDRIVAATGVAPAVNQVELHPYLPQVEQRAADASHGTATQSWTPLGRKTSLLDEPALREVAERHDADPGQVVLAWHLAVGANPIPKSATPARFTGNLRALDLTLSDADVAAIDALATGRRIGGDPAVHEEF